MSDPITRLNYRIAIPATPTIRHGRKIAPQARKPELAAVVGAERYVSVHVFRIP